MKTFWRLRSPILIVTVAVLGTHQSTHADVRPPIKITMPRETATAVAGEEYAGVFEVLIGEAGTLAQFEIHGLGWTLIEFDVPDDPMLALPGVLRIPFRAVASSADEPIRLSFTFDDRKVSKSYEIGPRYFARRDKYLLAVQALEATELDQQGTTKDHDRVLNDQGGAIPLHFKGRFVYRRSDNIVVGVDSIWVEVMDDDGLSTDNLVDETVWSGRTDVNGYFDSGVIMWDDCDTVGCDVPDLYVRFECDTAVAQVQDSGVLEEDYGWDTMDSIYENYPASVLDFGTILPDDSAIMPAFHIWNSIIRVHRFILNTTGLNVDIVDVQWPESEDGAFYVSFFEEIHIGPDREWREDTHTHEYGHHFLENYSENVTPDYCNDFCDGEDSCTSGSDCEDEGHCPWCMETDHDAWNEGWPSWLADIVTRSYPIDYTFDDCTPYTAVRTRSGESLGMCCQDNLFHDPWITEGYVSALLRDIDDERDDAHDNDDDDNHGWGPLTDCLNLGADEIFTVAVEDDPITPADFLTSFIARYPQHIPGLWKVASNVHPDYASIFPPDVNPPGPVTVLDSLTHPIGTGGPFPCILVEWEEPSDDVTGSAGFSVAWSTNPAGVVVDTVADLTGPCVSRATSPPQYPGDYYISIRAVDWATRWGPTETFGPFVLTDCNDNGIVDICEINCDVSGASTALGCTLSPNYCNPYLGCGAGVDCNNNLVPDDCDIASGTSEDCNKNNIPDECESMLYWVGPDGLWHHPSNWNKPGTCGPPDPCTNSAICSTLPGTDDDVCIRDGQANLTIDYTNDSLQIGTLACEENFQILGGAFPWAQLILNKTSWVDGILNLTGNITELTVNDTLEIGGTFGWAGPATLAGPGSTMANGGMLITNGVVQLSGHLLTLDNSSTAVSHGRMDFSGGSIFRIASGSTYRHQSAFDAFFGAFNDLFDNDGTFIKSVSTDTSVINILTDNSGLIHVQAGTLIIGRGSNSTGDFLADPGTILSFRGGGHELLASSSIVAEIVTFQSGGAGVNNIRGTYNVMTQTTQSGQLLNFTTEANIINYGPTFLIPKGTVNFDAIVGDTVHFDFLSLGTPISRAGTANFNSGDPISVDALTIGPGTIGGISTVTINGLLTWKASGHFSGSGDVNADGGIIIEAGGGEKTLRHRTLNNAGTATFLGSLSLQSSAVFNNLFGSVMDIQVDGGVIGLAPDAIIHNAGTLIKSAGGGTSSIATHVENTGTIEVQTGILSFSGSFGLTYVQLAGETILSGGDLAFTGNSFFDMQGGKLSGIGTVTGDVSNSGGEVAPGTSAGILNIDGQYTQGLGGTLIVEIELPSPNPTFDILTITGTAQLDGELRIELAINYQPLLGESFEILTAVGGRSGTFSHISNRLIGTTLRFDPHYGPNSVSLVVADALPGDGDFTGDGLSNLADLVQFEGCMTGPDIPYQPGCEPADMDGDGDVDIIDFGLFQVSYDHP